MSVMFRFFPTVAEESRSINDAMRMRGVGLRSIGDNPTVLLEYRLVPLLMAVVKIGDELSASALTRGLGGPEKAHECLPDRLRTVGRSVFSRRFRRPGILYASFRRTHR